MEIDSNQRISTSIDILSYLFISFFDILAKYTWFMFKINYSMEIKGRSFSKQIAWFLQHPNVDAEYTQQLKKLGWYGVFKTRRDFMAHNLAPIVIPERNFGVFGVLFCYNLKEQNKIDVEAFVDVYTPKMAHFLQFYGEHFLKKFG